LSPMQKPYLSLTDLWNSWDDYDHGAPPMVRTASATSQVVRHSIFGITKTSLSVTFGDFGWKSNPLYLALRGKADVRLRSHAIFPSQLLLYFKGGQ
jgi:hypothetical protein